MTTAVAIKDQKRPSGSFLETVGSKIYEEFVQFSHLEKEATWRALRIGLLLEHAKGQIEHGDFTEWLKEYVPERSVRTAQRFMKLARVFITQKKLDDSNILLLCDPDVQEDPKAKKVIQLVFEFVGDDSLNDLLDKYGIKERKPLGGARGNTHKKLTPSESLAAAKLRAIQEWGAIFKLLDGCREHQTYKYLDDNFIQAMLDGINVAREELRTEQKARKQRGKA